MNWADLEKHFSSARLGRYRASFGGDEVKAAAAYVNNMLLAEAVMSLLSVLEISLKNGTVVLYHALIREASAFHSAGSDGGTHLRISQIGGRISLAIIPRAASETDPLYAQI